MGLEALIPAAASVVGGMMASDGAQSAADTQAQATRDASAAQERMFNKQVELQEPWRQTGQAGLNQLALLLGLAPTAGGVGATPAAGTTAGGETADQIRARLLPNFQTTSQAQRWQPIRTVTDEQGLAAAVQAEQQRLQQAASQTQTPATPDPRFGSLLKTFTQADFQQDPGFAFRQSEGERGLQRAAAAGGRLSSGRYLKDAMRFNQGLATQEYGNAYDRFNNNQDRTFNKLASVSGIGQTAANNIGAAAGNFGSQIGANIIGAGNAAAAGQVGSANAINGGISQGVSMYQQNQLLNRLFPSSTPYNAWSGSPMSGLFYGTGGLGD